LRHRQALFEKTVQLGLERFDVAETPVQKPLAEQRRQPLEVEKLQPRRPARVEPLDVAIDAQVACRRRVRRQAPTDLGG